MNPAISICIPAYKRIEYLQKLLESISIQTFRDFEVVITDDSPDQEVHQLCQQFEKGFPIIYYKNNPALGTPENWNEGIRRAGGKWIKIMHDDDWFTDEHSLQKFFDATESSPDCSFFFSAFRNVDEDSGKKEIVRCGVTDLLLLWKSPLALFRKVYVGNPSCTLIRSDVGLYYDSDFKYVVDFEYYIRCIRKVKKWKYIDDVLLQIGFNQLQVTKYTFLVKEVQVPENHRLLEKLGARILRNFLVYDYYWRMYRNLGVRSEAELLALYGRSLHPILKKMIGFQKHIPLSLLKVGIFSKVLMTGSYIASLFTKA
jgi:glycosyltransferase involved in cell wall biosynthesis